MKTNASFAFVLLLSAHGVVGQLAILSKLAGKQYFGSAVDNIALGDKPYIRQLSNTLDFSSLTPVCTFAF